MFEPDETGPLLVPSASVGAGCTDVTVLPPVTTTLVIIGVGVGDVGDVGDDEPASAGSDVGDYGVCLLATLSP